MYVRLWSCPRVRRPFERVSIIDTQKGVREELGWWATSRVLFLSGVLQNSMVSRVRDEDLNAAEQSMSTLPFIATYLVASLLAPVPEP